MKKLIFILLVFVFISASPPPPATITITVNDNIAVDVRDTLCREWNYDGANTNAAKMAFLKERVAAYIKHVYITRKNAEAEQLARQTSDAALDSLDIN